MPNYQEYPNSKSTPSRLTRKQQRSKIFLQNKKLAAIARKARKEAREAAAEQETEE